MFWSVSRFLNIPLLELEYRLNHKNFSRVFHLWNLSIYIYIYIVKRCHDTPLGGEDLASESSLRCIKACHPIIYTWIYAETSRPRYLSPSTATNNTRVSSSASWSRIKRLAPAQSAASHPLFVPLSIVFLSLLSLSLSLDSMEQCVPSATLRLDTPLTHREENEWSRPVTQCVCASRCRYDEEMRVLASPDRFRRIGSVCFLDCKVRCPLPSPVRDLCLVTDGVKREILHLCNIRKYEM